MSFGIIMPETTIEPCKSTDQNVADVPSGDLISRADAIEAVCGKCSAETRMECALNGYFCCDRRELEALPSADRPTENFCRDCPIYSADRPKVNSDSAEEQIAETCDRPKGEWIEKEVMVDEDTNITEWQSARCSVCGRYHTTPFMYYFDNFNFCPNCGADMRPEK